MECICDIVFVFKIIDRNRLIKLNISPKSWYRIREAKTKRQNTPFSPPALRIAIYGIKCTQKYNIKMTQKMAAWLPLLFFVLYQKKILGVRILVSKILISYKNISLIFF